MTCVVVFDSVSASAPGKIAVTEICGGASVGNCEIGSRNATIRPNSMIRIASTQAKIGRSMKKRDIEVLLAAGRAPGLRSHWSPGLQQRSGLDNDLVAGPETGGDQPIVAGALAGLDHPRRGLVAGADDQHRRAPARIARDR